MEAPGQMAGGPPLGRGGKPGPARGGRQWGGCRIRTGPPPGTRQPLPPAPPTLTHRPLGGEDCRKGAGLVPDAHSQEEGVFVGSLLHKPRDDRLRVPPRGARCH